MSEQEPFTKVMRKTTRGIHNISDALVNAKLGFAMSDNGVWSGGLQVFYEIFKHLEGAIDRLKETPVGQLDVEGMRRTDAFERDLKYYLGEDWKQSYSPHPSVVEYLSHLSELERENPILLTAYIYHLYMGLFAGGQILLKKRAIAMKLQFRKSENLQGLAVVDMAGQSVMIKKEMAQKMNEIAESLDERTKALLIEESKNVFIYNNKIVHSVKGTTEVLLKKVAKSAFFIGVVAIIFYYVHMRIND